MPDEDGFATDEEIAEIYFLIDAGNAFQNAVATPIADLKALIADQVGKLTTLGAIGDPNSIDNWVQADFPDLITELGNADSALDDFLPHTNRISGTTFPGDILSTKPSFLALLAVSVTVLDIETRIGLGTTDTITDFFGSLSDFPDIIAGWIDFLTDLDLKIQILAPYEPPDFPNQPLPIPTTAEVASWGPLLDTTRSNETGSFNSAIETIIKWSMATTLVDPSGVWRDFVNDVVATPELQALLPEADE